MPVRVGSGTRASRVATRAPGSAWTALASVLLACGGSTDPNGKVPPQPLPTMSVIATVAAAVQAMPGRDSDGYVPPGGAARADFRSAIDRITARDIAAADATLGHYGYDVIPAVDAIHRDTIAILRERTPVQRGWGTYVVRLSSATRAMDIHVNHPTSDQYTETIGPTLYGECRCRWLLVAGTHRYANAARNSDMARETTSIFQTVHEHVAPTGIQAVSIHGFGRGNHDDPIASSDFVLSAGSTGAGGTTAVTPEGEALQEALRDAGFVVGLFPKDDGYSPLGATLNPQGRFSNSTFGHGRWMHVESAGEIRNDPARWGTLVDVLTAWFGLFEAD